MVLNGAPGPPNRLVDRQWRRDGQQVGQASGPATGNNTHAILWTGTAASAVDLNPSGFTSSQANGATDGEQAGSARSANGVSHAMLWRGTAASAVDPRAFLPSGFTNAWRQASARAATISGYAFSLATEQHALLRQPTSQPRMSFVASEMPASNNISSMPTSQGATSTSGLAASVTGTPKWRTICCPGSPIPRHRAGAVDCRCYHLTNLRKPDPES